MSIYRDKNGYPIQAGDILKINPDGGSWQDVVVSFHARLGLSKEFGEKFSSVTDVSLSDVSHVDGGECGNPAVVIGNIHSAIGMSSDFSRQLRELLWDYEGQEEKPIITPPPFNLKQSILLTWWAAIKAERRRELDDETILSHSSGGMSINITGVMIDEHMDACRASGWQPIGTAPTGIPFIGTNETGEDVYRMIKGIDGHFYINGKEIKWRPDFWMPLPPCDGETS